MATSSISKRIAITKKAAGKAFSKAIQQAERQKAKTVVLRKKARELRGEDIKKFFGA